MVYSHFVHPSLPHTYSCNKLYYHELEKAHGDGENWHKKHAVIEEEGHNEKRKLSDQCFSEEIQTTMSCTYTITSAAHI